MSNIDNQTQNNMMMKLRSISIRQAMFLLVIITFSSISMLGILNYVTNKSVLNVQLEYSRINIAIQNINQMFTNILIKEMSVSVCSTEEDLNKIQYKVDVANYEEQKKELSRMQLFLSNTKESIAELDSYETAIIKLDEEIYSLKRRVIQTEKALEQQTENKDSLIIKNDMLKNQLRKNQNELLDVILNTMVTLQQIINNVTSISGRVESDIKNSITTNVIVILCLGFVLCVTSIVFSRYLNNGIIRISSIIRKAANFDLTAKIANKEITNNEIGSILKDLNTMLESLSLVIVDMITNADNLSILSDNLNKSAATTVSEVRKQKTETEQIATSTNEMAYSAADVAKCSSEVNDVIQNTAQVVVTARNRVDNTIEMINALEDRLTQSSGVISKVDQQSQNINSVLDVITNITEQTNLLALNAAIEAARAGEHGRGFAVVADEVRELAKRSKSSANEIRSIITALQEQSAIAVKDISASLVASKSCVVNSNELSKILEDVKAAINNLISNVAQIATATRQQDASVQSTNTSIQYLSSSMDEALRNADNNSQISMQMADVSKKIHDNSNKFHVDRHN
jgi:methyl-accepting chemotaxis protein